MHILYIIKLYPRGVQLFPPNELMNQETLQAFWRGISTFVILRF